MGLLDGVLEGVAGAGIYSVVNKLINDHGGLQGVMTTLQQRGLGGAVESWMGTGANQALTPDQVHQALGADKINELAQHAGVTPREVSTHLANTLPTMVDKLTPNGQVPPGNPIQDGLAALTKLFN